MTNLNDKEKAAENKYAHDQEMQFKVHARAGKLLGHWAAAKLGLLDGEAEAYALALSTVDIGKMNNEIIILKIKEDFSSQGIGLTEHDIREAYHNATKAAHRELVGES